MRWAMSLQQERASFGSCQPKERQKTAGTLAARRDKRETRPAVERVNHPNRAIDVPDGIRGHPGLRPITAGRSVDSIACSRQYACTWGGGRLSRSAGFVASIPSGTRLENDGDHKQREAHQSQACAEQM